MVANVERVQSVKQKATAQFADVLMDGVAIPPLNVTHVG